MSTPITFNGTVYPSGNIAMQTGGAVDTFVVRQTFNYDTTLNGSVSNAGDTINGFYLVYNISPQFPGPYLFNEIFTATQYDNPDVIQFTYDGSTFIFSNSPLAIGQIIKFTETSLGDYTPNPSGDYYTPPPACFTTGTRIRTARGEIPVEELHVGDIAVTATGRLRRIKWIGSRTLTA